MAPAEVSSVACSIQIGGVNYVLIPADEYAALRGAGSARREDSPRASRAVSVAAKRVRDARRKAGISQVELARRLGRSQSTVSHAESGNGRLGERFVSRVLDACGFGGTRDAGRGKGRIPGGSSEAPTALNPTNDADQANEVEVGVEAKEFDVAVEAKQANEFDAAVETNEAKQANEVDVGVEAKEFGVGVEAKEFDAAVEAKEFDAAAEVDEANEVDEYNRLSGWDLMGATLAGLDPETLDPVRKGSARDLELREKFAWWKNRSDP